MESFYSFLLPRWFRYPGIFFIILGSILGYVRFYLEIKPDFLEMQTFAIHSHYFESKFLQLIGNNMSEEITGILIVTGLSFFAFARVKFESEITMRFRIKALFISFYAEICFIILSLVFFYGLSFVYMLMVDICFPLIIYILVFWVFSIKHSKSSNISES